jgi:plastocyanin
VDVRLPVNPLFVVAAALAGALLALPAAAVSETGPSIEAVNSSGVYKYEHHYWNPSQVAIAPGGTVTIANHTEVAHGVEWVGSNVPTCSAGVPLAGRTPSSGSQWSGTCTFAAAGVYTFYCTVHGPEMTGRVTVGTVGTTPTPTTPSATTGTPPPTPPATPAGPASQPAGAAPGQPLLVGLSLASWGPAGARFVRGSLSVAAGAVGGRLQVELLAARAALARAGGRAPVRVGMLVRGQLPSGRVAFRVALAARALRALRLHRRLPLTVRLSLTPVQGAGVVFSRKLLLRS